jgi:UPF0176 protein
MSQYQVLLFYKYTNIDQPEEFLKIEKTLWQKLNLKGRMIIAKEGVNATLEGTFGDTQKYIEILRNNQDFKDIKIKKSPGTGNSFAKASIKIRDEIVSLHLDQSQDFSPHQITGKYLTAEELHSWIESKKKFYIIDMRNDYEYKVGHFENSILLKNLSNFRDLPKVLPEIQHLRGETIVTVCTGGIRCEKASGFLVKNGFENVYQLKDGIHNYIEKYPNHGFLGKLYVFDGRFTIGFNTNSSQHKIIGKCEICDSVSENYVDYKNHAGKRTHGIVCINCIKENKVILNQGPIKILQKS